MASGSQNMTTYNARTVTGSNSAASPAGALLLSGAGRANDATGDTWIFFDSGSDTSTPWGIKHDQANNKIHIYGNNTDSVWTRMDTGDTYILGKVGIGYDPETSENLYKLYINGTSLYTGRLYGNTGNGLEVQSLDTGTWKEGIRVYNASDNYSVVCLCNNDLSDLLSLVHNGSTHAYYIDIENDGTYSRIDIPSKHSGIMALTDGYGASGTWDISITGSARYVQSPDTRSTNPAPSTFSAANGVSFDFKQGSVIGLTSASYSGVMTYRPYASGTDWSGGNAHQLAFNNAGLYWRQGGSSWGNWTQIVTSSGTWGISITGNAATANAINNDGGRRASSEYMHADGKIRFYLATSSMTTGKPPCDGFIMKGGWDNTGGWDSMFAWGNDGHGYIRGSSGSGNSTNHTQAWKAWNTLLDSNNYTAYTVTKTGSGASGTWGISITGRLADSAHSWTATEVYNYMTARVLKAGDTMTGCLSIKTNTNQGTDTLLYIEQSNNNDWGIKVNKTTSYDYGIQVTCATTAAHAVQVSGRITGTTVYGAVWNDYAEFRKGLTTKGGICVYEQENGLTPTIARLQAGCRITSDTFGFAIGETEEAQTPIAVCGRVLVYPYANRQLYQPGDAVCSAPNGTVDIMTREEIRNYPERIVGIVSEIPNYEIWHAGAQDGNYDIQVNGRIWIYVR